MKQCFKCGLEKPLDEFYCHPRMADGHLGKCKECTKSDVSTNYRVHRDHYREYERKRNTECGRKEMKVDYEKKRRKKNPEKYCAHKAVYNAIRKGTISRQPCEICGGPAEAHHEDYSKPLDVRWLCFEHHRTNGHGQLLYVGASSAN